MTEQSPEERARALVERRFVSWRYSIDKELATKEAISGIATAIREAVDAEREACAALCERHHHSRDTEYAMAASNIANAIRSRSEKP